MTIKKKIAAIAMAAMMTTTMAISASAESETGTFMGYHYEAMVTAITYNHTQWAWTYYDSLTADVYVGLAVANAKTGMTIKEVDRTGREGTNKFAEAELDVDTSPITVFSSHEIIPHSNDDPWARYFKESYIIQ